MFKTFDWEGFWIAAVIMVITVSLAVLFITMVNVSHSGDLARQRNNHAKIVTCRSAHDVKGCMTILEVNNN